MPSLVQSGALVIVRPGWWRQERTEALGCVVGVQGRRLAVRRWLAGCRRWTPARLYPAFAIVRSAKDADLIGVELGPVSIDGDDQLNLGVA